MDRSAVIKLISEAYTRDSIGAMTTTETEKTVYCQVQSVSANEFFEGGRSGLNPELRFSMFAYDYNNEKIVEYEGIRYAVYRVYKGKNDMLDLYVERRKGDEPSHLAIVT